MVTNGRGTPNGIEVLANTIACPACGAGVVIPAHTPGDHRELRFIQISAGLTCNIGFFAMLALRAFDRFTLDWFWTCLYIFGVGVYSLVVSKALTVRLKGIEFTSPFGKASMDASTDAPTPSGH